MIVKESINVLKGKDTDDIKSQVYYFANKMTGYPAYAFRFEHVLDTFMTGRVLYNDFTVSGHPMFDEEVGEEIVLKNSDKYAIEDAKPLEDGAIAMFDKKIKDIEKNKQKFIDAVS